MLKRVVLLVLLAAGVLALQPAAPVGAQAAPACADGADNDGDGLVDLADDGCVNAQDSSELGSAYSEIVPVPEPVEVEVEKTVEVAYPLAVVVIRGTSTRSGAVKVSRVAIRARRGSVVRATCAGKRCPRKRLTRTVGRSTNLRLKPFERTLRPGTTLTLRVGRKGQLGKYVRFKPRRRSQPLRVDACVRSGGSRPVDCYRAG